MQHKKTLIALSFLAVGLSACASGPEGRPSAGDYFHDSSITTKVKTALIQDPDVHAMSIHVRTQDSKVELTGYADSQKEIDRAAEIAAAISGVEGVKNDIQLKEKEVAAEAPAPESGNKP